MKRIIKSKILISQNAVILQTAPKLKPETAPLQVKVLIEPSADSNDIQIKALLQTDVTSKAGSHHQHKTKQPDKNTHNVTFNIDIQILGGFIAAIGCAAVAIAFTVLNAANFRCSRIGNSWFRCSSYYRRNWIICF